MNTSAATQYAHGMELWAAGKNEQAVKLLGAAARGGHAEAQFMYGQCLFYGIGTERVPTMAVIWYRMADRNGDLGGTYRLAQCAEHGAGMEKNDYTALRLYRKAASQGHVESAFRLSECTTLTKEERTKWLDKAVGCFMGSIFGDRKEDNYAEKTD